MLPVIPILSDGFCYCKIWQIQFNWLHTSHLWDIGGGGLTDFLDNGLSLLKYSNTINITFLFKINVPQCSSEPSDDKWSRKYTSTLDPSSGHKPIQTPGSSHSNPSSSSTPRSRIRWWPQLHSGPLNLATYTVCTLDSGSHPWASQMSNIQDFLTIK